MADVRYCGFYLDTTVERTAVGVARVFTGEVHRHLEEDLARCSIDGTPLRVGWPITPGPMPCGYRAPTIQGPDDFPLHDVPCPCGDSSHWVVKWQELADG